MKKSWKVKPVGGKFFFFSTVFITFSFPFFKLLFMVRWSYIEDITRARGLLVERNSTPIGALSSQFCAPLAAKSGKWKGARADPGAVKGGWGSLGLSSGLPRTSCCSSGERKKKKKKTIPRKANSRQVKQAVFVYVCVREREKKKKKTEKQTIYKMRLLICLSLLIAVHQCRHLSEERRKLKVRINVIGLAKFIWNLDTVLIACWLFTHSCVCKLADEWSRAHYEIAKQAKSVSKESSSFLFFRLKYLFK